NSSVVSGCTSCPKASPKSATTDCSAIIAANNEWFWHAPLWKAPRYALVQKSLHAPPPHPHRCPTVPTAKAPNCAASDEPIAGAPSPSSPAPCSRPGLPFIRIAREPWTPLPEPSPHASARPPQAFLASPVTPGLCPQALQSIRGPPMARAQRPSAPGRGVTHRRTSIGDPAHLRPSESFRATSPLTSESR